MKIVVSLFDSKNIDAMDQLNVDSFLICDKLYSSSPNGMTKLSIKSTVHKIHKKHKEVIVKVDRLYQQSEITGLIKYLCFLDDIKVDYVMFSDVAIINLIKSEKLVLKTIYAPETLLTNKYDVLHLKNDGVSNCVVSKDIPLQSVYKIADEIKDYCYCRIHGPILISYSKRRFISTYLNRKKEYLNAYYLQEESRNNKMPIVEKKTGSWLYYGCLESIEAYQDILERPFAGLIFDNILYDDQYTINVLKLYQDNNDYQSKLGLIKKLNESIEYISINDIKMTQLDKE